VFRLPFFLSLHLQIEAMTLGNKGKEKVPYIHYHKAHYTLLFFVVSADHDKMASKPGHCTDPFKILFQERLCFMIPW
jgi:hypothetical protein